MLEIFNYCIEYSIFPTELKCADVSALHKKGETTKKNNYRPISILPTISKVRERLCDKKHLSAYKTNYLPPFPCGFRKDFSTQHALSRLLEKLKISLDSGGKIGAIFLDLSKAFDCLRHDRLLAKLELYGLSHCALTFIYNYLHGRQQRVNINGSFSSWKEVTLGVPQDSVLGPMLFNIFIYDLFLQIAKVDICNYADDTTLFASDRGINRVISRLEIDSAVSSKWFYDIYMNLNEEKCHLITLGTNHADAISIKIGSSTIHESNQEKLLGVIIDNKLTFEDHIRTLCKKVSNKLYALSRISHLLVQEKLRILMKAFIYSQFQYCPLAWMLHRRKLNNNINKLHERVLRITYRDQNSSFESLLKKIHLQLSMSKI